MIDCIFLFIDLKERYSIRSKCPQSALSEGEICLESWFFHHVWATFDHECTERNSVKLTVKVSWPEGWCHHGNKIQCLLPLISVMFVNNSDFFANWNVTKRNMWILFITGQTMPSCFYLFLSCLYLCLSLWLDRLSEVAKNNLSSMFCLGFIVCFRIDKRRYDGRLYLIKRTSHNNITGDKI